LANTEQKTIRINVSISTDRFIGLSLVSSYKFQDTSQEIIVILDYIYPNVNHGFHNDTTPRFEADAAKLAWKRTIDFFKEKLV
jgi:dienelactone hydrolase